MIGNAKTFAVGAGADVVGLGDICCYLGVMREDH
jgi:hypothetical protein